jgi:ABC-type multidrug transport system fused ATPase/permease subunit
MDLSKLFAIIPSHRKKQLPAVVLAMVIGAGIEVLGLGLVLPLLDVISGSDNEIIENLKATLPASDREGLVFASIVLFAFIYVCKGLYLAFLAWVIGSFTYGIKADVSNNLMRIYMDSSYEFHIQNNSSQLIRNLTTESAELVTRVLNPLLLIMAEGIVIIAISIFLITLEPIGAVVSAGLLMVFSAIFQRQVGRYASRLGAIRQSADGMVIQTSQETFAGIKDVVVQGVRSFFWEKFRGHNETSASALSKGFVITQLPRVYLETIGVLVFSVLLVALILKGENFLQIAPTLGVFALAAFRLLPSANRILSSLSALRFADEVVSSLYKHNVSVPLSFVTEEQTKRDTLLQFSNHIKLDRLSYRYPDTEEFALREISLVIRRGESIGLVGKSGSGKSTLSDVILGLLHPTSGSMSVDGLNVFDNLKSWQKLVGYVQQDIFLLDSNIQRNIAFGNSDEDIDLNRLNKAIKDAQLEDFVNSLPEGVHTELGELGVRLSGGQKQRIGIARALYREPQILVFDEATSALDNETEAQIVSAIRSLKGLKTIIVIAHRLSTIEHCDRLMQMHQGRITELID